MIFGWGGPDVDSGRVCRRPDNTFEDREYELRELGLGPFNTPPVALALVGEVLGIRPASACTVTQARATHWENKNLIGGSTLFSKRGPSE